VAMTVVIEKPADSHAPVRRPLASRPRAPRPPGRSHDHPLSTFGRFVTRAVRPLQLTPPGKLLRGVLRRSCLLREVTVDLARGSPDLDGFRMVLLSDLHVGFFFSDTEFAELASQVSAWSPDLICLVGDLVDQEQHELQWLRAGLAALRAREAVVAVPGNHDYAADPDLRMFHRIIEQAGVVPLLNRGMRLQRRASSLWIGGVDDLTAGNPDLEAALSGLREDEPAVVLSHHPDLFREAAHAGVDLTLAGHTHGGQITWFGQALLPGHHHTRFGYWQGRHHVDGAQLLVGRGVGVCVLPVRIAAAPEVLLIEIRTTR
jgi:predicted MPP superfamily phosphohydrolase